MKKQAVKYNHAQDLFEACMQFAELEFHEELAQSAEEYLGNFSLPPDDLAQAIDWVETNYYANQKHYNETIDQAFRLAEDEIVAEVTVLIDQFKSAYSKACQQYLEQLGLLDTEAFDMLTCDDGVTDFCLTDAGHGAGVHDGDPPWSELDAMGVDFDTLQKMVQANLPKYQQPLFDDCQSLGGLVVPYFVQLVKQGNSMHQSSTKKTAGRMFKEGDRVQISDLSGINSRKMGVIVSPRLVETDGRGIPTNIPGAYKPVDWKDEVAIKLDDGELITMYKNRVTKRDVPVVLGSPHKTAGRWDAGDAAAFANVPEAFIIKQAEGFVDECDDDPVHVAIVCDVQGYGPHIASLFCDQNRYHASPDTALQGAYEMHENYMRETSGDYLKELEQDRLQEHTKRYRGENPLATDEDTLQAVQDSAWQEADEWFRETMDGQVYTMTASEFIVAVNNWGDKFDDKAVVLAGVTITTKAECEEQFEQPIGAAVNKAKAKGVDAMTQRSYRNPQDVRERVATARRRARIKNRLAAVRHDADDKVTRLRQRIASLQRLLQAAQQELAQHDAAPRQDIRARIAARIAARRKATADGTKTAPKVLKVRHRDGSVSRWERVDNKPVK